MNRVHGKFSGSSRGLKAVIAAGTILSLAVMAVTGFGQVHEVVGGHVLDANPQAGSGGSNTPVHGYVPMNGNAIIYGQVSGLARFHGTVGSSSPDVFQGNLPSGQIEDFARQSASLSPTYAPQPYVLPSNIVAGSGGALYSDPINSGFDPRLLPGNIISAQQVGTVISGGSLKGAPYRVYDQDMVSTPAETTGIPGRALSDPLFSQRGPLLDTTSDNQNPAITLPGRQMPNKTPNGKSQKPLNGTEDNSSEGASGESRTRAIDGQVASRMVTGMPGERTNGSSGTHTAGTGLSDVGPNGERGTDGSLNTTGLGGTALGEGNTRRPTDVGATAMVTGTYKSLQAELDQAEAKARAEEIERNKGLVKNPGAGGGNPAIVRNGTGGAPGAGGAGGIGGIGATGVAGGASGGPGVGAIANGTGTVQHTSLADSTAKLQAGKKIAPLKTLADIGPGAKPTPMDVQLKDAETLLKDGKYLDAVDSYQQALVLQPENALALAGRANAELAAGMYQSAAYDLKFLYTKKPEMASVRFALADFIPQQRIDMVMKDLFKLTPDKTGGNTASFLYCYLAYNTNHARELKDELTRWEIRSGHDAWQAVAAKAWGQ